MTNGCDSTIHCYDYITYCYITNQGSTIYGAIFDHTLLLKYTRRLQFGSESRIGIGCKAYVIGFIYFNDVKQVLFSYLKQPISLSAPYKPVINA